jgi:hypothetical protein
VSAAWPAFADEPLTADEKAEGRRFRRFGETILRNLDVDVIVRDGLRYPGVVQLREGQGRFVILLRNGATDQDQLELQAHVDMARRGYLRRMSWRSMAAGSRGVEARTIEPGYDPVAPPAYAPGGLQACARRHALSVQGRDKAPSGRQEASAE